MKAIYIWLLPDQLLTPPSYARSRYDPDAGKNRFTPLVGDAPGGLPIRQDCRISRLRTDRPGTHVYRPRSRNHGVYAFVLEGETACDGARLGRRDSQGVWGVDALTFEAGAEASDILIVETIM